jgi:hypothetical protein
MRHTILPFWPMVYMGMPRMMLYMPPLTLNQNTTRLPSAQMVLFCARAAGGRAGGRRRGGGAEPEHHQAA